ncbi:MAG: hypothetical protein ACYC8T_15205 [Myxococcaceae bacterium]
MSKNSRGFPSGQVLACLPVLLTMGCGFGSVGELPDEQVDAGNVEGSGGGGGGGGIGGGGGSGGGGGGAVSDDAGAADAGTDAGVDAGIPITCPAGMTCVTSFPFGEDRDTKLSALSSFKYYSCASTVDEGGPEIVYAVIVPTAGFLSAAVWEQAGVNVDVHLLSSLDPQACLARGSYDAKAHVGPGLYYVVIDTLEGTAKAGAFHVDIGFTVPSLGSCDMLTGSMPRVNDNGNHLAMPATGHIVREAHLVTQEEPPPRPTSYTQYLSSHYALSQSRTGYVMRRWEWWAPLEGGTFYGAGINTPTLFPVLHEAWYVCMFWTTAARPAPGTRMILRLPGTSRAVVVAAGYETGPFDLTKIGGAPEEIHYYLGSNSVKWTLGIAADQTLPYGPRECE